jgi:hypothetical protein
MGLGLGSTRPLKRNDDQEYFLVGKGGRCVGLTTLLASCAECLKIWEPQPPGTLGADPERYRVSFTFYLYLLNRRLGGPQSRSEMFGKQIQIIKICGFLINWNIYPRMFVTSVTRRGLFISFSASLFGHPRCQSETKLLNVQC